MQFSVQIFTDNFLKTLLMKFTKVIFQKAATGAYVSGKLQQLTSTNSQHAGEHDYNGNQQGQGTKYKQSNVP